MSMEASRDADRLIESIEDGQIHPRSHDVIRAIFSQLTDIAVEEDLVLSSTEGTGDANRRDALRDLWAKIDAGYDDRKYAFRLLVGLLHPDKALDWHEAEYLIDWSRRRGLDDQQIIRAFGVEPVAGA
ncbi:MAG: hypothetical protein ACT6RD_13230 [Brevundimonas sp.]|uniref:hypothetical protein n=2 Tax=Brevundimonas sp. TaxID=1871086 RepID=UPI004033E521